MFFKEYTLLVLTILLTNYVEIGKPELTLVHVLCRHGDRTPEKFCPKDPYKNSTFQPYGLGELTNKGEWRAKNMGECLGHRYGSFLGNTCTQKNIVARSSEMNRTRMTMELLLDELCSENITKQIRLDYTYVRKEDDVLFLPYENCPNFEKYHSEYWKSEEGIAITKNYSDILKYLSNHCGEEVDSIADATLIYSTLQAEGGLDLPLPEWANKVYPILNEIAGRCYGSCSATENLKKICAGMLIQKIVEDTFKKINGSSDTRLILYVGHDINIACLLNTLGLFEIHAIPYGACVLVEIHNINDEYGVKIFYKNFESIHTGQLTLPDCEEFCPWHKFVDLVRKYFFTYEVCGHHYNENLLF